MALLSAALTGAAGAASLSVIGEGHVDVSFRLDAGELRIGVDTDHGHGPPKDPAAVILWAAPAARTEVPANPAFAFLGRAGDPLWLLPQVQDRRLVWPGWSTEAIPAGQLTGEGLAWTLVGVDGPGTFTLFVTDQFGSPSVLLGSAAGAPRTFTIPPGTHAHGNWAFGAEGTYRLSMEARAVTAEGRAVSGQAVLTVAVGGERPTDEAVEPPPTPAPAPPPPAPPTPTTAAPGADPTTTPPPPAADEGPAPTGQPAPHDAPTTTAAGSGPEPTGATAAPGTPTTTSPSGAVGTAPPPRATIPRTGSDAAGWSVLAVLLTLAGIGALGAAATAGLVATRRARRPATAETEPDT